MGGEGGGEGQETAGDVMAVSAELMLCHSLIFFLLPGRRLGQYDAAGPMCSRPPRPSSLPPNPQDGRAPGQLNCQSAAWLSHIHPMFSSPQSLHTTTTTTTRMTELQDSFTAKVQGMRAAHQEQLGANEREGQAREAAAKVGRRPCTSRKLLQGILIKVC